jgi:predicted nucleotidyltransferase
MKDDLLDKTLEVIARLNDEGVDYVVIGAVALNLHGLVRATGDLDFFIRPEPDNISALRRALMRVWDDPEIQEIKTEDLCGAYPAIRYGPPDDSLPLDILTRLGEFVTYADLKHELIEIEGIKVRVATPSTLYWLKASTVRPQDKADAAALRAAFGSEVEQR